MKTIKITLDLPPKELHPNGRTHWRAKNEKRASYLEHVVEETQVQCKEYEFSKSLRSASIQGIFYRKSSHKSDSDNLNAWLKYAIDGLVHAGLLINDDRVTLLPPIELVDKKWPRVTLLIHDAEDCFYGFVPSDVSAGWWVCRNSKDGTVTHSVHKKDMEKFLAIHRVKKGKA